MGTQASYSVAVTQDGKCCALGLLGGTIHLYRTADWRLMRTMTSGPDILDSVAFSPDGTKLVSVEVITGLVEVWSVATGKRLSSIVKQGARTVACSPDNTTFVVGGGNYYLGAISLRDYAGNEIHQWQIPFFTSKSIAFSPNGQLLALAGEFYQGSSPGPYVFRMSDYQQVFSNGGNCAAIAFSPNGDLMAGIQYHNLSVWRVSDWALVTHGTDMPDWSLGVQFTDDSAGIYSLQDFGTPTSTLYRWDLQTGSLINQYSIPTTGIAVFAPIRGAHKFVITGQWGRLSVFDCSTNTVTAMPGDINISTCMALSRDASLFAYTENNANGNTTCVVRRRSDRVITSNFVVNNVECRAIDMSPDKAYVAATYYGGNSLAVKLIRVSDGAVTKTFSYSFLNPSHVRFTADGLYVVAATIESRQFVRWRVSDAVVMAAAPIGTSALTDIDLSASGTAAVTVDQAQVVRLIGTSNFSTLRTFPIASAGAAVAVSPSEALVACGESNGTVTIWSASTGQVVASANIGSSVRDMAFSNANTHLAICTMDNRLLDLSVSNSQVMPILSREVGNGTFQMYFLPGDSGMLIHRRDNAIVETWRPKWWPSSPAIG